MESKDKKECNFTIKSSQFCSVWHDCRLCYKKPKNEVDTKIMESKDAKYQRIRSELLRYRAFLYLHSVDSILSRTIRKNDLNADGSPAANSHIGIGFSKFNRLFIIDSNPPKVAPALLSDRITKCESFEIIAPLCSPDLIESVMEGALMRAEQVIYYDELNVGKAFLNNRINDIRELFGAKKKDTFELKARDKHDVCSDWAKDPAIKMNMVNSLFSNLKFPTPQDYLRYRNPDTTVILK